MKSSETLALIGRKLDRIIELLELANPQIDYSGPDGEAVEVRETSVPGPEMLSNDGTWKAV